MSFINGLPGHPGKAATVKIGKINSGETISVVNSGTETDAVLDFTIPLPGSVINIKGDKGDKGDKGQDGEGVSLSIGKVSTGTDPRVVNSGTKNNIILDFTLPTKGEKGDKGEQGDKGQRGEQGIMGSDGRSAYDIAVRNGFVGGETDWLASLNGKNAAINKVKQTLTAADWTEKKIIVKDKAIKKDNSAAILLGISNTDEQYNAFQTSKITTSAIEDGSLTLRCVGDKPSIDIPVEIILL